MVGRLAPDADGAEGCARCFVGVAIFSSESEVAHCAVAQDWYSLDGVSGEYFLLPCLYLFAHLRTTMACFVDYVDFVGKIDWLGVLAYFLFLAAGCSISP